jgi:hypothetical protein
LDRSLQSTTCSQITVSLAGTLLVDTCIKKFASEDIVEKAVEMVKGVVDFMAGNNMVLSQPSLVPSVAAAAYLVAEG